MEEKEREAKNNLTWRRSVKEELKTLEMSWGEAQRLARDIKSRELLRNRPYAKTGEEDK